MDTAQDFSRFTIEPPLVPSCDDSEAPDRATCRKIASRIAEIHLLAMDSNPLLHAQCPTPESLMAAREFLVDSYEKAVLESCKSGADGGGGILVARKTAQAQVQPRPGPALRKEEEEAAEDDGDDERKRGDIIGFATWEYTPGSSPSPDPSPDCSVGTEPTSASALVSSSSFPTSTVTTHDHPSCGSGSGSGNVENPKKTKTASNNKLEASISQHVAGCQRYYLDEYARLATQAKAKYFGSGRECYQLSFICVDPAYQGHGVGSALTLKVLELARGSSGSGGAKNGLPVYLESTLPAVRMYQKLGFKDIGSFEMVIPVPARGSTLNRDPPSREGGMDESVPPDVAPSTGPTEISGTTTYKEICMVWYPYL